MRASIAFFPLLTMACASAPPSSRTSPGSSQQPSAAGPPKVLNVVLVGEPWALTPWKESTTDGVFNLHEAITNGLTGSNVNSEPVPRLAAEARPPALRAKIGFSSTPGSSCTRADRLRIDREIVRLISTDLPIMHTIYEISKEFQKAGVTGMVIKTGLDPIRSWTWNIHEWDRV